MSGETPQSSYWAVITAPVLESRTLTDGAKLFYAEISRRTNQRGYCWASNQALAEALELGERTVTRYVAELEAEGFIFSEFVGVKDRKRHAERRIRLAVPAPFGAAASSNVANSGDTNIAKNGEVNVANSGDANVAKNGDANIAKNGEVNIAKSGNAHKENNKSKNNNPLEPPSGGKRQPERAKWMPERFEAFWAYYRKNVNPANRAAARRAWDKLKPDDGLIGEIGRALAKRLKTDAEWRRGIGRPHASTYLNGQMWLDTWPTAPVGPPPQHREGPEDEEKERFGVWT